MLSRFSYYAWDIGFDGIWQFITMATWGEFFRQDKTYFEGGIHNVAEPTPTQETQYDKQKEEPDFDLERKSKMEREFDREQNLADITQEDEEYARRADIDSEKEKER